MMEKVIDVVSGKSQPLVTAVLMVMQQTQTTPVSIQQVLHLDKELRHCEYMYCLIRPVVRVD